jgi:hypothetical protein
MSIFSVERPVFSADSFQVLVHNVLHGIVVTSASLLYGIGGSPRAFVFEWLSKSRKRMSIPTQGLIIRNDVKLLRRSFRT